MINESWTHSPGITKAYLTIDGYKLVARKDRLTDGRGGGLLLYAKSGFIIEELSIESTFNQFISVSMSTHSAPLIMNLIYRSPNSNSENNQKLNEFIKSIKKSTIVIGDMNYNGIDWNNYSSNPAGNDFFTASQDAFLTQHVDFPTHEGNTIDLVLSTNDISVHSVSDVGNLGKSHHSILRIQINTKPSLITSTEKVPDYAKADFVKMKNYVSSVDWVARFEHFDTFQCWDLFKETLSDAIKDCIPLKDRRTPNKPLWMNRNIMRLIRKKRRLWNWYKTTKDNTEYQAYLSVQKSVAKTIRSAKRNLERKLAKNFKRSPRQFYAHMNNKMKSRVQVGPLKNDKDDLVSDSEGMSNIFNRFFTSIFTDEDTSNIPRPESICQGPLLSSINVNVEEVKKKLDNLKIHSAGGPDKLGPRVLKELDNEVALPLSLIFNKSLLRGEVPPDWRCANVTPVFKKGSRSSAENYRPISLTSITCKILESLIADGIIDHLSNQNLIHMSQHGFMQHRSCLTNLIQYLETLTSLLDKGHNVDVFYLDLSKAFDRVPHQRLLAKLESHGITAHIYNWIKSWLSNRKQRVVLNGSCSNWADVTSGVPQGSVLGPLLFTIFINDIDNAVDTINCFLLKFADDTKGVRVVNSEADALKLQEDLDSLYSWSVDWQILFNLDKCHVLHFGNNNPNHNYFINGHQLSTVEEEKDLGVYITNSCTPRRHVSIAAAKANQVLGQLLRSITYRDSYTFVKLYKQYVRPHLEYCVQAWSPWLRQDIELIENVQRRAIKAVSGLSGTYEEKLSLLNLLSLEERRKRGDMIQTFKIVHKIDNVNPEEYFEFTANRHEHATRQTTSVTESSSTQNVFGLSQGHSNLDIRKHFFTQRVIPIWNDLPNDVRLSNSVATFKMNYDESLNK